MIAIDQCPKNLLVLSVFDFSLYLQRDVQYRLKNQASIILSQKISSRTPTRDISRLLKHTLTMPRSTRPEIIPTSSPLLRRMFRVESTKSDIALDSKQFEYDDIEAPQTFSSDLHVDWRLISLVFWSKCYCRYESTSSLTSTEQALTQEIGSLEEQMKTVQNDDREAMKTDAFHSVCQSKIFTILKILF